MYTSHVFDNGTPSVEPHGGGVVHTHDGYTLVALRRTKTFSSVVTAMTSHLSRKREIDEQLRGIAGQIKRAKQEDARAAKQWVLRGGLRRSALLIYVLTDNSLQPVVSFLRRRGRQNQWHPKADADLKLIFLNVLDDANDTEINELLDGVCDDGNEDDFALAYAEVLDWSLAVWVAAENHLGSTPSTAKVS